MKLELGPYGPRLVTTAGRPVLPDPPPSATHVTAVWAEMPRPVPERMDVARRLLARQVERLGSGWRHTPEQVLDAKTGISAELRQVARELER